MAVVTIVGDITVAVLTINEFNAIEFAHATTAYTVCALVSALKPQCALSATKESDFKHLFASNNSMTEPVALRCCSLAYGHC